tara:strand:- start:265 stop:909 length:645 start_codon:yes stop_codon:yes gene_type:complete
MGSTTVAPKAIKNPDGTTTEQAGRTYSSPIYALIDQTFDKQGNLMGRASGGGLLGSVPGIVKPSASAAIKAPEPTPEPKADPNMKMFVGSDLADKAEFSRRTGLTEVDPSTEKRIKDLEEVKDDLLAKAKERRSKTQEVKEDALSRMSSPTSDLSEFDIQNYRAGGAKMDRGEESRQESNPAAFKNEGYASTLGESAKKAAGSSRGWSVRVDSR